MPHATRPQPSRSRSAKRGQDGAVMLIVLLIIMTATAGGILALNSAMSEMQATGQERVALQTRSASEAALTATKVWIDLLGGTGQWLLTWQAWRASPPPDTVDCAEPPVTTVGVATRTTLNSVNSLDIFAQREVPPLANAGASWGAVTDPLGSFGPARADQLAANGIAIDITDCQQAPASLSPGSPSGGAQSVVAFNCVVTARGRLQSDTATRPWAYPNGLTYNQPVYASSHDTRLTILTPEMLLSAGMTGP